MSIITGALHTERKFEIIFEYCAKSPWAVLILAQFIPASCIALRVSWLMLAGPIVQTIFVFFMKITLIISINKNSGGTEIYSVPVYVSFGTLKDLFFSKKRDFIELGSPGVLPERLREGTGNPLAVSGPKPGSIPG